MSEYLLIGLVLSGLMNGVLLVRLARRGRMLRDTLRALRNGSRELRLVTLHLVQISRRHTQLRGELRELQGIIQEQDRAIQIHRSLLSRMRGAACPCEKGRR